MRPTKASKYRTKPTCSEPAVCYSISTHAKIHCNTIGIRAPREPFFQPRRRRHDFILFLVTKGEIYLTDEMPEGDDQWTVRPGEIHVMSPDIFQSPTRPFAPGIEFLWIHFEVSGAHRRHGAEEMTRQIQSLFGAHRESRKQSRWFLPRQFSLQNDLASFTRLHQDIQEEWQLWGMNDGGVQTLALAFLYRLHKKYLDFLLNSRSSPRVSSDRIHADRAMVYIRRNYSRPLSNRHIARALQINGTYLGRCFRRITGRTMGDAIQQVRIEAARRLLSERYHSVKEIAQLCGFQSSTYFGRIFKRLGGLSAGEYSRRFPIA